MNYIYIAATFVSILIVAYIALLLAAKKTIKMIFSRRSLFRK